MGYNALAPYPGAEYDLVTGHQLAAGNTQRKEPEEVSLERRGTAVFRRLLEAGKRLMTVISHNQGGTNKDLAKFADQINALCDKWDR